MGRSANDDRSDVKNPNNDAYWADQTNRFGDDSDDAPAAPHAVPQTPATDDRFGADPHPILGRRSNRLPSLSSNFARHAKPPEVVPWNEDMSVLFSTDESEKRDRSAALMELLNVSEWILKTACDAIVRQENSASVQREETPQGLVLTLRCREKHRLVLRELRVFGVILIEDHRVSQRGEETLCGTRAFGFARLRWRKAMARRRGYWRDETRTREADDEARRHQDEIVSYELDGENADPAFVIVETVRGWAERRW